MVMRWAEPSGALLVPPYSLYFLTWPLDGPWMAPGWPLDCLQQRYYSWDFLTWPLDLTLPSPNAIMISKVKRGQSPEVRGQVKYRL